MKKTFPTFIDASAEGFDAIVVSAGKVGHQVELSPKALAAACGAAFAEIAADKCGAAFAEIAADKN